MSNPPRNKPRRIQNRIDDGRANNVDVHEPRPSQAPGGSTPPRQPARHVQKPVDDGKASGGSTTQRRPGKTAGEGHAPQAERAAKARLEQDAAAPILANGMTLGMTVVMKRLTMKMSQKNFAELLGINPSTLCKIEKDKQRPSVDTLKSLAKVTDSPISEFL